MSNVINIPNNRPPEPENLKAQAYNSIRNWLMTGKFVPGERIVIDRLAKEMGTSPTPVREAVLMLVHENVLEMKRAASCRVPKLSSARYSEIRKIRIELQCLAAREAMKRNLGDDVVELMESTHLRLLEAQESGDRSAMLECNEQFQMVLPHQARMPVLVSMLESLWMQAGPVIHLIFKDRIPTFVGPHPHLVMIGGLRRNSPDTVCQAIKDLLMESGDFIIQRLKDEGL